MTEGEEKLFFQSELQPLQSTPSIDSRWLSLLGVCRYNNRSQNILNVSGLHLE